MTTKASLFALLALVAAPLALAAPKQSLDFVERFETFDETRWFASDGWANAEWMASTFRRAQIEATPEGLVITLAKSETPKSRPYDGGEIRTHGEYPYGYFEARLRMPAGWGLVSGFFTYAGKTETHVAQEIDVEFLGRDPRHVELTIHTGALTETKIVQLPFDASADFHTYGFEWRAKSVRWYIDGKPVLTMRGRIAPIPDRPQTLMLDLWNSERLLKWSGGIKPGETGPWQLTATCVTYAARYRGKPHCAPDQAAPAR